jgi:hypothetical protein
MADNKESVQLEPIHGSSRQGPHHDQHPLIQALQKPEGIFTGQRSGPGCFFLANIILLALTAQIFQKTVFNHVELLPASNACDPATCVPSDTHCQSKNGTCSALGLCEFAPIQGASTNPNFQCFNGQYLSVTDSCFGKQCQSPPDAQCAASTGTCHNGQCQYQAAPDGTLCTFDSTTTAGPKLQRAVGWTCQQGVCTSPSKRAIANFAYTASIQAGIIGSALAIEVLVTGSFTPDLAALAINAGLIVIGWDGRFVDVGLERATGLGRTQVAFGFIAGALAVILGAYLIGTRKGQPTTAQKIIAWILIALWLVAFGIVSEALAETFEHMDAGVVDNGANIAYNWAYLATIFAASVNIALAHAILRTGSYTSGFAAFAAVTGIIALAWVSKHNDYGTFGPESDNSFTSTVLAWQSFGVIAGAVSFILGMILAVMHKPAKTDDDEKQNKTVSRGVALLIVIVFFTLIGIVAALYDKSLLDRSQGTYGNDERVVGGGGNYANNISPFAWEFSIWSSAVAASFGIELLVHGGGSTGIAALTATQGANLVGWAAKHSNVGSVRAQWDQLKGITRAWEGVALVAGVVAVLVALSILRINAHGKRGQDGQPPVVVHPANPEQARSLNPEDRYLFHTEGGKPRDEH